MVVPVTLAFALKTHRVTISPVRTILSIVGLTILLLGMVYTQSRSPWVGLAAALVVFLVAVSIAIGWRSSLRALLMLVTAFAVTWGIVTFIPAQIGRVDLAPRVLSAASAVIDSLNPESSSSHLLANGPTDAIPTSMETRLILWKGATQIALQRPWFQ
jgi:hypothetical protein